MTAETAEPKTLAVIYPVPSRSAGLGFELVQDTDRLLAIHESISETDADAVLLVLERLQHHPFCFHTCTVF